MDEREIFNRLFLIIPEMRMDSAIISAAVKAGIFTDDEYLAYEKMLKDAKGAKGKIKKFSKTANQASMLEKIATLAPELMSVQTINLLSKFDLVDTKTAQALRVSFRAVGALQAAAVSDETLILRAAKVLSPIASEELISIARNLDQAQIESLRRAILQYTGNSRLTGADAKDIQDKIAKSVATAERLRGALRGGKILTSTAAEMARSRSVLDAMLVGANTLFSDNLLKAAIKTGVISAKHYDTVRALQALGLNVWTKSTKAFDYDSFWARAMMVSEGILSPELVKAARQLGLIDDVVEQYLYGAVRLTRSVSRKVLEQYVSSRKFRVTPGESPIQTYARITRDTDRQLMQLLAEASKRSRKEAEALMKTAKFGAMTRAQQQRILNDALYGEMRKLSEQMGYAILFGEKEAAAAAREAEEWLQRSVLGRMSEEDLRSLKYSARSGMDSFLSRQENRYNLSTRVYGNLNVWQGRIEKEIQIGLLRGLSARELARSIEHLIDPKVRGGVSYAAMRLARTEINNAFHATAIRYTREMPWVVGYKWNLSSSHPRTDICNNMANDDHDDLGPGVYAKKSVPGKPHPHCFCYVTTVDESPGQFERNLLRGKYDRYMQQMRNGGVWDNEGQREAQSNGRQVWESAWGSFAPQIRDVAVISGLKYIPRFFTKAGEPLADAPTPSFAATAERPARTRTNA